MILGIGSDLVDIRRVEEVLVRHGERFTTRCFTDVERAKAESRRMSGAHIASYAKRFAAKEACSKALGTGFNHGIYMKDITVTNDENGKPVLKLTGGALEKLMSMTPQGAEAVIHLTLSDEPPIAQSTVIIEAR